MKGQVPRKMRGDVLRINITPAGRPGKPGSFPWIQVYRHPHGIDEPASYDRPPEGVNASRGKPRNQLALEIGEAVIKSSNVLKKWLPREHSLPAAAGEGTTEAVRGGRHRSQSDNSEAAPGNAVGVREYRSLLDACQKLPPAKGNYLGNDYVANLMTTVLDYQLNPTILKNVGAYYETHGWQRRIRTLTDLKSFLERYPDDDRGNRAAAVELWGYNYGKRIRQLRRLVGFFEKSGVTDQQALRAWARSSSFEEDFRGKIKGLGYAIYQWLIMRQGVESAKPDVHVLRFVKQAMGRDVPPVETVELIKRVAQDMRLKAYELDWRIWEYQRGLSSNS